MSSTNKTANYDLSQFIGTDVPGWLSDYNSDNAKIDAGIHAAKTQADAAAQSAGQAANDIQTINSTLSTQSAQISAAAQSASAAQTSAGAAQNAADANSTAITALGQRVTALEGSGGTTPTLNIQKVSVATGAQGTAVDVTLPTGWNISDTEILGFYVNRSNSGVFYVCGIITAVSCTVYKESSGIKVIPRTADASNGEVVLILLNMA